MQKRTLGKTGFSSSPLGFGTYRVNEAHPEHEKALLLALNLGVNLIDTSTNYEGGSAERLIGRVLKKWGRRDEVFVVTKAGYVQGDAMRVARERIRDGKSFPEMIQLTQDLWHCIAPDFLSDQLTRSLDRLQLPQVDALLLHNPEYFLKKNGDHAEYYRRIRLAFEYLETEVASGRIRYYGISSNSFPDAAESEEFTSLQAILEFAGPHFALIQLPFNLLEGGGFLEENNFGKSVLTLAHEKNLGVLINRPLNAFHDRHLIRLASFPSHENEDPSHDFKNALRDGLAVEAKFQGHDFVEPSRVAWAHIIKDHLQKIDSIDQWKEIQHYQAEPALENAYATLSKIPAQSAWVLLHRSAMNEVFSALTLELESRAALISRQIQLALEKSSSSFNIQTSLSQQALQVYLSLKEISCVLVGMRNPNYVKDSIEGTELKTLSREDVRESLLNAAKFL